MKTSRSLQIAALATTVVSSLSASISLPAHASNLEEHEANSIVQMVAQERLTQIAAAESGTPNDRSPMPGDSRR